MYLHGAGEGFAGVFLGLLNNRKRKFYYKAIPDEQVPHPLGVFDAFVFRFLLLTQFNESPDLTCLLNLNKNYRVKDRANEIRLRLLCCQDEAANEDVPFYVRAR